jgi:hypothetical protein
LDLQLDQKSHTKPQVLCIYHPRFNCIVFDTYVGDLEPCKWIAPNEAKGASSCENITSSFQKLATKKNPYEGHYKTLSHSICLRLEKYDKLEHIELQHNPNHAQTHEWNTKFMQLVWPNGKYSWHEKTWKMDTKVGLQDHIAT